MLKTDIPTTAVQTNLAAIFLSLELSRSTWLITSLSPGNGEKMSKHSVEAGNIVGLIRSCEKEAEPERGRRIRSLRSRKLVSMVFGSTDRSRKKASKVTSLMRLQSLRLAAGCA